MKTLAPVGNFLAFSLILVSSAFAQSPPAGAGGVPQAAGPEKQQIYTRDTIATEDLRKLADFMDNESIIERKDLVSSRIANERVGRALALLKVDCKIINAAHVAEVTGKEWGWKNASVGLYEAACESGAGYLVTLRDTHEASATLCFAAESQIKEPAKASRAERCLLPENAVPNMRAQKMLGTFGINCAVDASQWLGESATLHLDYIESRCKDGQGYVIHVPVPGSPGTAGAMSCEQSATVGIPCTWAQHTQSASDDARPDLNWFKEQLKRAGVSCDVLQARIVGREKIRRRYVVEFQCRDNPNGLVAFVPPDSTNAKDFESMDCIAAAVRGVRCEYSPVVKPMGATDTTH